MAIENRKLGGKNPRLIIDLNKMFGSRVPDSNAFRNSVGQAIIDEIRSQSLDGRDKNGKRFQGRAARYSDEYEDSIEFKAAGKSKTDVNMRLTGDMLGLLDIVGSTSRTITIGWSDNEQAAKAYGHILGTDPGPKVRRDFFGLSDESYDDISKRFRLRAPSEEVEAAVSGLLTLGDLFGG